MVYSSLLTDSQQHSDIQRAVEPCLWASADPRTHWSFPREVSGGACSLRDAVPKAETNRPPYLPQLRDYWMSQVSEDGSIRTNLNDGISKMTLDVIGLAGESCCVLGPRCI